MLDKNKDQYKLINETQTSINQHILRIEQAINEMQGDIEYQFKKEIEERFMD